MGAVREARWGIRGFVSAHSSCWVRQAPPLPPRPPIPGRAPLSLSHLRGSAGWTHCYPPALLGGSGGLRKDFYPFAFETPQLMPGSAVHILRAFCRGKAWTTACFQMDKVKLLEVTLAVLWAWLWLCRHFLSRALACISVALRLWNWEPRFGVAGPKPGADGGTVCQLAPHEPLGS